jgi:hypothetical protein
MALGPGKFDDLRTLVRERAGADGAIVICFGKESAQQSFSCQADPWTTLQIPKILRSLADAIELDTNDAAAARMAVEKIP